MNEIRSNIEYLLNCIEIAAIKAGRNKKEITLIGVTKTVDVQIINKAIEFGINDIGENKVQELMQKTKELLPVNRHFIGALQTNKARQIVDEVCLIHSLDRIELAKTLEKIGEQKNTTIHTLIQVNIAKEATKGGIFAEDLTKFLEETSAFEHLQIDGLMAIPPKSSQSEARKNFSAIRELFEKFKNQNFPQCKFKHLSMGMSGDYEQAIAEGATFVRVGNAIFGKRI